MKLLGQLARAGVDAGKPAAWRRPANTVPRLRRQQAPPLLPPPMRPAAVHCGSASRRYSGSRSHAAGKHRSRGGPLPTAARAQLERIAALPAAGKPAGRQNGVPGTNYKVISPAQPTNVGPGKVEVIEMFW